MRTFLLGDAAREIMRREGLSQPPEVWQIRRLFESGTLPEPGRLNRFRVVDEAMLPIITIALRQRGWLPNPMEAAAAI